MGRSPGAGHYVKMVHNGIEYGDMQLICEAYWMLKVALGLTNDELYDVFQQWYEGELNSYLIEITRDIFSVRDPDTGGWLVDVIMDTAGAKGTGKWMSQLALDLGVPSTLVTEAVYARCLSAMKDARVRASKLLRGPTAKFRGDRARFIEQVRQVLYASKICSYAQGYVQMQAAAAEHNWPLRFGEIALLWRGGCIIRAVFLERIKEAFDAKKPPENLLLAPYFKTAIRKAQTAWRNVVTTAVRLGIPTPAFAAALAYYDGYRSERLPANLLQAQRDYLALTPIAVSTKRAYFIAIGCGCGSNRRKNENRGSLSGHRPKVGRERARVRALGARRQAAPPSPPAPLPQTGEGR